MKRVLYLLPVLCLILFACKKDNKQQSTTKTAELVGMWRLYQYWNSPGAGPVVWTAATENKTIYLGTNLAFNSNVIKGNYYLLALGTDTLLKIYKLGSLDITDTSSYFVKLRPDTLVLNFVGCIEGCSEKYIRQPLGALGY